MGEEQRRSERFQIRQPIRVQCRGENLEGTTENLSIGGAMIRLEVEPPLAVGERVRVSFSLPELSAPVEADADVRWVGGERYCFGIQFVTGLRAQAIWALQKLFDDLRGQST